MTGILQSARLTIDRTVRPLFEGDGDSRVRLMTETGIGDAIYRANKAETAEQFREAFKIGRAAAEEALDMAERYATIRELYAFADSYDGGDELNPLNARAYHVAEGVAYYLSAGRLNEALSWRDHWRFDGMVRGTELAWLRDRLLDEAFTVEALAVPRKYRPAFQRAARYLACVACEGNGMVTLDQDVEGGQFSIEEGCPICSGSGARS